MDDKKQKKSKIKEDLEKAKETFRGITKRKLPKDVLESFKKRKTPSRDRDIVPM